MSRKSIYNVKPMMMMMMTVITGVKDVKGTYTHAALPNVPVYRKGMGCTLSYMCINITPKTHLELVELLSLGVGRSDLQHVESDGLRQRTALTDGDDIAFLHSESGRDVASNVLVSLFVSVVLGDVVQVVSSDDDGSVHLGGNNSTGQDLTSDGNFTDEGALLVDVGTVDGFLGGLVTKTNFLVPSLGLLTSLGLGVGEDVGLLLESSFGLNGQFGGHLELR